MTKIEAIFKLVHFSMYLISLGILCYGIGLIMPFKQNPVLQGIFPFALFYFLITIFEKHIARTLK
jgi:hypothetical protein